MDIIGISIPVSVTKIGLKAFYDVEELMIIDYAGTTQQWSSIIKGSNWNQYTGN